MQRTNPNTNSTSLLSTVKSCAKFVIALDIISLSSLTFTKTFMYGLGFKKTLPEYVSEKSINALACICSTLRRLIKFVYLNPEIYTLGATAVTGAFLFIAIKCIRGLCALKSNSSNLNRQKEEVERDLRNVQRENRNLSAENENLRKANSEAKKEIDALKEQLYIAKKQAEANFAGLQDFKAIAEAQKQELNELKAAQDK